MSGPPPARSDRRLAPTVAVSLVAGLLFAPLVRAQSDNAFERVEPGLEDAAYIGVVLPLGVGLALNPTSANSRQEPPAFDEAVREALVWDDRETARSISDALLLGTLTAAAFMPLLVEWELEERTLNAVLVSGEALLTTHLLTELVKQLTGRQRPNEFYAEDPTEPEHHLFLEGAQAHTNRSFFSGHASMAFGAATMVTAFAYEYDWLDPDVRWIVPTLAYSAALTTGYLRIAGDRHWLTDVLVGALVGTATSYLVFAIRTE